jgi:Holliday junction resolvase RusA-like endonuclease
MHVHFTVCGTPATQGSKRAFVTRGAAPRAVLVDNNPGKLRPWRDAVRYAAAEAMAGRPPLEGPVIVRIVFAIARPKSHPKTRRTWPTGKLAGDVDKLVRAVFDALTDAGVFGDDSQVVQVAAFKDFAGFGPAEDMTAPGADILIRTL